MLIIQLEEPLRSRYTDHEIKAFQRGLSTLTRPAPNTYKARFYVCEALVKYKKPLRTPTLEVTLLANLLMVYVLHDEMKDALSIVKLGLEFQQKDTINNFGDPRPIFHSISLKVLKRHYLQYNRDLTDLIPIPK